MNEISNEKLKATQCMISNIWLSGKGKTQKGQVEGGEREEEVNSWSTEDF